MCKYENSCLNLVTKQALSLLALSPIFKLQSLGPPSLRCYWSWTRYLRVTFLLFLLPSSRFAIVSFFMHFYSAEKPMDFAAKCQLLLSFFLNVLYFTFCKMRETNEFTVNHQLYLILNIFYFFYLFKKQT